MLAQWHSGTSGTILTRCKALIEQHIMAFVNFHIMRLVVKKMEENKRKSILSDMNNLGLVLSIMGS